MTLWEWLGSCEVGVGEVVVRSVGDKSEKSYDGSVWNVRERKKEFPNALNFQNFTFALCFPVRYHEATKEISWQKAVSNFFQGLVE